MCHAKSKDISKEPNLFNFHPHPFELTGLVIPNRPLFLKQASSKMLKIAPATVVALAGAFYAFTALSHHVQVEVFVI